MVEFPGDNGSYYADGSRPSNTEPLELDRKLVMAAVEGQLLRVEHLLARGAVVHFSDIRNEASEKVVDGDEIYFIALIEAACFGHVAVVRALIKAGADANQRTAYSEWQACCWRRRNRGNSPCCRRPSRQLVGIWGNTSLSGRETLPSGRRTSSRLCSRPTRTLTSVMTSKERC